MNERLASDRLYTLAEVCDYLRISPATARRWIKQGRLPARKIGRDYRISGRDLERVRDGVEQGVRYFTLDSPLLKLAGIADSGHKDLAEEHDRYLAEWLDERE